MPAVADIAIGDIERQHEPAQPTSGTTLAPMVTSAGRSCVMPRSTPYTEGPAIGSEEKATATGITESITAFMCALYAHVLGRTAVRPDDDFFADLNGDSLAAAQVIVVLQDLFEINVVEAFFDDSSAGSITPILERHLESQAVAGRSWAEDSSLLGGALKDDIARLRDWFARSGGSAFK